MNLISHLQSQIQQHGAMSFVSFMQQALYMPGLGFYANGAPKFGREGSFVTAPELTPLFGQTLAAQCQPILSMCSHPTVFEFGAGTGRLCADLMMALEQLNCLPESYYILDVSGALKAHQAEFFQATIPHLLERIHWITQWPERPFAGVVLANEVLDAMPVHRFLQSVDGVYESYVTLDNEGHFKEVFKPCEDERLMAHVKRVVPRDYCPYQSEVNLFIDDWIKQCFDMMTEGVVLILDYGFPRHEFYHPDRSQGTLMCHYRHQAHSDPFQFVGEQDITAHVDFTHVAEAAEAAGFHVAGFTNQASFLLANGLLTRLSDLMTQHQEDLVYVMQNQHAVKQLLQPSEMGELFKVMALTKQWEHPLVGFQLHDKRASLSL